MVNAWTYVGYVLASYSTLSGCAYICWDTRVRYRQEKYDPHKFRFNRIRIWPTWSWLRMQLFQVIATAVLWCSPLLANNNRAHFIKLDNDGDSAELSADYRLWCALLCALMTSLSWVDLYGTTRTAAIFLQTKHGLGVRKNPFGSKVVGITLALHLANDLFYLLYVFDSYSLCSGHCFAFAWHWSLFCTIHAVAYALVGYQTYHIHFGFITNSSSMCCSKSNLASDLANPVADIIYQLTHVVFIVCFLAFALSTAFIGTAKIGTLLYWNALFPLTQVLQQYTYFATDYRNRCFAIPCPLLLQKQWFDRFVDYNWAHGEAKVRKAKRESQLQKAAFIQAAIRKMSGDRLPTDDESKLEEIESMPTRQRYNTLVTKLTDVKSWTLPKRVSKLKFGDSGTEAGVGSVAKKRDSSSVSSSSLKTGAAAVVRHGAGVDKMPQLVEESVHESTEDMVAACDFGLQLSAQTMADDFADEKKEESDEENEEQLADGMAVNGAIGEGDDGHLAFVGRDSMKGAAVGGRLSADVALGTRIERQPQTADEKTPDSVE